MTRTVRITRTPVGPREPDVTVEPPAPTRPTPVAAPGRAGAAAELARLAGGLLVDPSVGQQRRQQAAVSTVLSWLEAFPGQDWQDRWLAGLDLPKSDFSRGPGAADGRHR